MDKSELTITETPMYHYVPLQFPKAQIHKYDQNILKTPLLEHYINIRLYIQFIISIYLSAYLSVSTGSRLQPWQNLANVLDIHQACAL
jgi:hypothetical protein